MRETAGNGLLETVLAALRPFVSDEGASLVQGVRRERRRRYPPEALREALVNAVAHRDWTRHEEVEIASSADRLEVASQGILPHTMTIRNGLTRILSACPAPGAPASWLTALPGCPRHFPVTR